MKLAILGVRNSLESTQTVSACNEVPAANQSGNMAYENPEKVAADNYENGGTQVNGKSDANGMRTNGIYVGVAENRENMSADPEDLIGTLPPEIQPITTGYVPLAVLIPRLVQETFNGLTNVIDEMSELEASLSTRDAQLNHVAPQLNGAGAATSSQANVQKKLRMLNFAQDRRAQFIKILVLSQWSRQAPAIGKVIDLTCWLNLQKRLYKDAKGWMGELRRMMASVKTPNADLETALEALSLAKAPRLPDLGYLPLEPLSPQQILEGLRKINAILSIRMNLHEKIPSSLREFSISSGKVIFHVRDEFVLELSIADEDPSSQLYFIDFRLAFSPAATEIPGGRLRDDIEGRANDLLKREGLAGCFTFLHDLVLTYKVTILKNQASEMARGLWSENLRVEAVHRSLVVQYWLNKPGGKNWMEIGIKRQQERSTPGGVRRPNVPHVALRWFRSGKLVTDTQFDVDVAILCLEKLLKQVIAAHTTRIFEEMATRLKDGYLYSERLLKLKHNGSKSEPLDAFLLVQFTPSKAIKLLQNPITGKFALLPASPLHNRAEQGLNALPNPGVDAPLRIVNLRCTVAQEEVETYAHGVGWERTSSLDPAQEVVRRHFPREVSKFGFFRKYHWNSWVLAFTTSLMGDSWWIVELDMRKAEVSTGKPQEHLAQVASLKTVFRIPMDGLKSIMTDASYSNLAQIERMAVSMISKYVDSRHLAYEKIKHQFKRHHTNLSETESAVLHVQLNPNHSPAVLRTPSHMNLPWIHEAVALAFGGLDPSTENAIHTVSGRLKTPISNIKSLPYTADRSIFFHPKSGAFGFHLLSSIGKSTIPMVLQHLSSIDRLIYFLDSIKSHKLSCHEVSLTHIDFVYASTPSPLTAKLDFPSNTSQRISLDKGNPHIRILDFINSVISSPEGLGEAIRLLQITLPLLQAIARIEKSYPSEQVVVLPRSLLWYEIRYEDPRGYYDVTLRTRRDRMMWMVKHRTVNKADEKTEQVAKCMKQLEKATGQGWRGMRGGIVASDVGIDGLVGNIDEIHRDASKEQDSQARMTLSGKKRKAEDEIMSND